MLKTIDRERRFYLRNLNTDAPEGCVYFTYTEDTPGVINWRAGWSFRHKSDQPNKQISRRVAESRWNNAPIVGTTVTNRFHLVRAAILMAIVDKKLCPRRLEKIVLERASYDGSILKLDE